MTRRRWLLRSFPRAWQKRYGDELESLVSAIVSEEGKLSVGDRLDLIGAGLRERATAVWHSLSNPRSRVLGLAVGGLAVSAVVLITLSSIGAFTTPEVGSSTGSIAASRIAQRAAALQAHNAELQRAADKAKLHMAAAQQAPAAAQAAAQARAQQLAAAAAAQAATQSAATHAQPNPPVSSAGH